MTKKRIAIEVAVKRVTRHVERQYIAHDGTRALECDCAPRGGEVVECPTRKRREYFEALAGFATGRGRDGGAS